MAKGKINCCGRSMLGLAFAVLNVSLLVQEDDCRASMADLENCRSCRAHLPF